MKAALTIRYFLGYDTNDTYSSRNSNFLQSAGTQFYSRQKILDRSLLNQTLSRLNFYDNRRTSNVLWTQHFEGWCVCNPAVLLGPEPALGIPKCLVREAVKNWTETLNLRAWIDLPGLRHGKLFIDRPCKKRTDELLKLVRHQLKMVTAIYTELAPVRGQLYTMGLFDGDPICRFCGMETETV